ncbi:MAG: YbaB/EbfC family nucleoid-associated protein [Acidimicrobiia bacterium]|nr:YbaB/EbfC family nucleoid-associated protein [Acidimicrobiia bacterium]NNK91297.1 YbaB/EbfC family nucleoid-associated protein [Acidimicrobiia bacterium]
MGRMPKDLRNMMQQAQQMQAAMAEKQAEVADKTFSGSAGGGVVTAVVKGSGELVSVEFDPAVLDPDDPELVGDLVVAAVNAAMASANEEMSSALGGLTGGMDLGGLLG